MAATLARASAVVSQEQSGDASIKQRKVTAKSTIHDASAAASSEESSSDESEDFVQPFIPPTFTVKDLLGELSIPSYRCFATRS